jgi:hypothetical protein
MRVFVRRKRAPGTQLSRFEEADCWHYSLRVTNVPERTHGWRARNACIDAACRVHARVEDRIRTGNCGIGRLPSPHFAINSAWLTASLTAATLLAGSSSWASTATSPKPSPRPSARILHTAARLVGGVRRRCL